MSAIYGEGNFPHLEFKPRPLQVYVGETRSMRNINILKQNDWGRMWTASKPNYYHGEKWGLDNGAYSHFLSGKPFPEAEYRKRVQEVIDRMLVEPTIAVLPDMVGKGMKSIRYSLAWLDELPEWPWYLAVQDRCTAQGVQAALGELPNFQRDQIVGLFLGGTDRFKRTALAWRHLADNLGLRFHYGRAGTLKKIRHARNCMADSLDSAFPLWTKQRMDEFVAVLNEPDPQTDWVNGDFTSDGYLRGENP